VCPPPGTLGPFDTRTGGSIIAIGLDGQSRPGWPIILRRADAAFTSVVIGPDGTVYAVATEPEAGDRFSVTILAITPNGRVRYRTTVATGLSVSGGYM
jgi:hypothetical protein